MPSKRKQTNMRLADEATERLEEMTERMSRVVGHPVSHADVVSTALAWMKYRLAEVEAAVFTPPGQPKPFHEPPRPAASADGDKHGRKKK